MRKAEDRLYQNGSISVPRAAASRLLRLAPVAALLWLGNWLAFHGIEAKDQGITTEAAALVMFLVGAMVVDGHSHSAIVVTGATIAFGLTLLLGLALPLWWPTVALPLGG
ncbi:MAG: hypothetical protein WB783_12320 [Arenicellales bacterium]|jgi:uncharacterized membrane protein (DUF4010 family)